MIFTKAAECRQDGARPAHVTRVHFEGIERTKDWALKTETRGLFQAKNFHDLIVKANETKIQMQKDGLFDNVVVLVDIDRSDAPSRDGFEITFVANEPSIHKAFVGMDMSNRGEGSLVAKAKGQSVFGAGESASASVSRGNERTTSFHVDFEKPFLKWRDARLGLNLFRCYADYPWSKFALVENAAGVEFRHEPWRHVTHRVRYLGSWRRVDVGQKAAFEIREHAGHSFKSSLQNVLTYDTQDDAILPTRGILLRLAMEAAGIGGDAKFDKHELATRLTTTLPLGVVLSLGGQLTYIRPRGGRRSLSVVDRTFVGGAVNLRGFDYSAVGPSRDECYLGGTASWVAACHVYRRLFPSFAFAHGFAAVGGIYAAGGADRPFGDVVREMMTSPPRCSLGAGLVVKLGQIARLEFNYCLPMSTFSSDRLRPGFQFGIGVDFV